MNLVRLLLRSARSLPERPALAVGKRMVSSYGELVNYGKVLKTELRRAL